MVGTIDGVCGGTRAMSVSYETLLVEDRQNIRIITLNRPERLNAFNRTMRRELPRAVASAVNDEDVKAIVITGAGRGFCAGADLSDPVAGASWQNVRNMRSIQEIVDCILKANKPVIAAVNGPAAGGGFGIALACDQVIASTDAFFLSPFIHGPALIPDFGLLYLLPRVVGLLRAKEILMRGERIPAQSALAMGMVNEVVEGDKEALMHRALEVARRLCDSGPAAFTMTKKLLHLGLSTDWQGALEYEALAQAILQTTDDYREGSRAFLERRRPNYTGN